MARSYLCIVLAAADLVRGAESIKELRKQENKTGKQSERHAARVIKMIYGAPPLALKTRHVCFCLWHRVRATRMTTRRGGGPR